MLLQIKSLLDPGQVADVLRMMDGAPFVYGGSGARADAQEAKRLLHVDRANTPGLDKIDAIVIGQLARHALVRQAVLPKSVLTPVYSRHEPGHDDGFQTDSPLLGQPRQVRTDVAATVFLSDPGSYEGGELVLRALGVETRLKLAPGDAVVYPTGVPRQVSPVRVGVRLAIVTWMQSLVGDAARREILLDVDRAVRLLGAKAPDGEAARLATKAYGNLFRMWAEV